MKKYVLSAVVAGLLVAPSAYSMDEGLAPPVEVEVPPVEITVPIDHDPQVVVDPPVEVDPGVAVDPVVDPPVDGGVDVPPGKPEICEPPIDGVVPVDENGNPVVYYCFGGIVGGLDDPSVEHREIDVPKGQEIGDTGVFVTALNGGVDAPLHTADNFQPNFRSGMTDRGAEALAANSVPTSSDAPSPQLLNDEQRGAVRGLRNEEESTKPRAGFSKLFSKLSKPKSEIVQTSATTNGKSLAAKLAEVDRMRDTALRTGDEKMLARADKLEKRLRAEAGKPTRTTTRTK